MVLALVLGIGGVLGHAKPILAHGVVLLAAQPKGACVGEPGYASAVRANEDSLAFMSWEPFRRGERGWQIYAPLIARQIGTTCPPTSANFARALAVWQRIQGAPADGVLTAAQAEALLHAWQSRRGAMAPRGVCPDPAPPAALIDAHIDEGYLGKRVQMRAQTLAAYRALLAAARREVAAVNVNRQTLTIFSAYRSPEYDEARCESDGRCNGIDRAACSRHRTGLALDLNLGAASGYGVDSTADANRLFQTRTRAYVWLVYNADRFGFVNYAYEPWHWEWASDVAMRRRVGAATP